jgi:hypothetical protein
MKFAWIVLAVLAARFVLLALAFPAGDGDLVWQQSLGDRILREGHISHSLGDETFTAVQWTPQEWLFGIGVALSKEHGAWFVFAAGAAAAAIGALVLTAQRTAARGASALSTAVVTALAALCMFESFGVRAQVIAWPLLAATLWLLEVEGPLAFLVIPLAALWSNLHGSAMLAPVLVTLAALGAFLDDGALSPRVRRLGTIAAASAVAICLNPFGIGLPLFALSLFASPIKAFINEWKVTDIADPSFSLGAFPLILAAAAADPRMRMPWRDRLVLGAGIFLLLTAARNIAIFGIIIAPFAALGLDRLPNFLPLARRAERPLSARAAKIADRAIPALGLVVAVVVGVMLWNNREARRDDHLPTAALAALGKLPGEHRLFCWDFAWCSFDARTPRTRIFLDGRSDAYPIDVWRDFAAIAAPRPNFRERIAARGIDAIVTERGAALDAALHALPEWHDAFSDAKYRLWIKASGERSSPPKA